MAKVNSTMIRVHPDFKKKLKLIMIEEDRKSLTSLTKDLAQSLEDYRRKEKKKDDLFKF